MLSCHQLWEMNFITDRKSTTEGSAKTPHRLLATLPPAGDLLL